MSLSIVIPAYEEERNVSILHKSLVEVLDKIGKPFEIIFVNDGSKDNTLEELKKLTPVKIINFRRNFGQTAAIDAGIKNAKNDIIITLDSDLQNDPNDIPSLLEKLEEGYDVVSGWRKNRKDPLSKKIPSRIADKLRSLLINDQLHDSGCTLKVYKRECFEGVNLYGEMHRFIPAILKIRGYKVGEVVVTHHERVNGITKYNYKRILKGFIDLISVWFWQKYSNRPLHLFGGAGIFLIFLSFISFLGIFYDKFVFGRDISNSALFLLTSVLFLVGIILFVCGILADIMIKTYYKDGKSIPYNIKEIIEK